MTDTDRLRDLLEQAAPAHPDLDPTTRAATVARRGRATRIRDRALVGAAAVAVVAAAVVVPLTWGDGGPDYATPAPAIAEPCPAEPVNASSLGPVPALGDVVAVRSCPAQDSPGDALPIEPLTGEHAQAFADDLATMPTGYEPAPYCAVASVEVLPWALQVQTASGELITLGSTTIRCSSVRIDGKDHSVSAVLAVFKGNLDRQQAGTPALACPTGDELLDDAALWNSSFDPAAAESGIVCRRRYSTTDLGHRDWEVALTAEQLAIVRDDISPNTDESPCSDVIPTRLLVLQDADGDQAAWAATCRGGFAGPTGTWRPTALASSALDEAFGLSR
jgi:hypothetical protein